MQEACLICEGSGRRESVPCPYCAGAGQVRVRSAAPATILMATGSCKLPVRRVSVEPGFSVQRLHTLPA
jgi:DnaJ-class molecular chaperone